MLYKNIGPEQFSKGVAQEGPRFPLMEMLN